jgi:hypothetical protein
MNMVREASSIRYTIPPGIASKIALKTRQHGECIVRRDGKSEYGFKLYADDEGMIRFYVRPTSSEALLKLIVECTARGEITRYPLELRFAHNPTREMPAPAKEQSTLPPKGASVRPALSERDRLHLSDKELLVGAYPPRPDPKKAPESFERWCTAVSVPVTVVEPHVVSRPEISHGLVKGIRTSDKKVARSNPDFDLSTSTNWNGYALTAAGPYVYVETEWYVPAVVGNGRGKYYSALFAGIDGLYTDDLLASGTEQDVFDMGGGVFASTYNAWTQLFPNQAVHQQITNITINPGDHIAAYVWVGDGATGQLNLNGDTAIVNFQNMTTRQVAIIKTAIGGTTINGRTVEWIMSRPTVNGSLSQLANYGSALISIAAGYFASGAGWTNYRDVKAGSMQIRMVTKDILSKVTPIDWISMKFTFQASN